MPEIESPSIQFKNVKGYKVDLITNSVIVNEKFYKSSLIYGTPEYELVKAITSDYPDIEIRKEKTRNVRNKYRCMTYEGIEAFIARGGFENSEELLNNYELVKKRTFDKKQRYNNVREWFITQFPDYEKLDINHYVTPLTKATQANA